MNKHVGHTSSQSISHAQSGFSNAHSRNYFMEFIVRGTNMHKLGKPDTSEGFQLRVIFRNLANPVQNNI